MAIALALAMWIDHRVGEPSAAFHPVVWMGKYLQACGRVTVGCAPAPAFLLGALAWCAGAVTVGAVAWGLQALSFSSLAGWTMQPALTRIVVGVLLLLLLAWMLKTMLSWRMLRDEVAAVESSLQQSLQAGRQRLAMLVSRDTATLSESEVRESAIESLAENLNDSVVAPVFWFVLFGLPGAAVYRFANTADAMWGYRGLRDGVNWEWAGKWAARADDMLSWLPGRITALLLWLVAGGFNLQTLALEARKTPSPNSGWPMAAMALALGVRLGKPGVYVLHQAGRSTRPADTASAQKFASKVVAAHLLLAQAAIILIATVASL
ncbi:adenosylcobinamide-phosphate synthase CbiB [Polaromonas sp.]|jgi:adenosylcobinamide-phosphate synthase|uniref:adenosylcobinamide-phosphate synthase CbiB n=1 Tax=Polaromonas sp. TaxID=1869339 RepID=UPI002BC6DFD5|nr:adenosylcobinamide-phosphate synthase CbiB [Polaromonas sp.]HQS33672.1 adenosylcobinamide-phosphate synthase CbiB [Polaromonas sp.]HQS92897.1 adenosylcobinamide-phosphate synthase CbiB [Polaromonas sp.]